MSHLATATLIAELLKLGLLKGSVQAALDAHIASVFMPHGLGHLVGLDVHDPAVYPFLLRPPLNLTVGMVLTCEPGVYFIPGLLARALDDPVQAQLIDAGMAWRMASSVGGVRIEDTIVINEGGPEVISRINPAAA